MLILVIRGIVEFPVTKIQKPEPMNTGTYPQKFKKDVALYEWIRTVAQVYCGAAV